MMLKLHDSKLFTTDTAIRFSREYKVKKTVWNEIWKRHLNGVDDKSLCGYLLYDTGIRISTKTMRRWLAKTEVYCRAATIMNMGVRIVQSEFFGIYEEFVLDEILQNMKFKGTRDTRIVV